MRRGPSVKVSTAACRAAYEEHGKLTPAARSLGIHSSTLLGRLLRDGVDLKLGQGRPPILSPEQEIEAVCLYNDKRSLADVGKIMGVNHSTISRILDDHHYPKRTWSQGVREVAWPKRRKVGRKSDSELWLKSLQHAS
jgi:hypothetical protein